MQDKRKPRGYWTGVHHGPVRIGGPAAVQGPIASILLLLTGRLVDLPLGKNAVRGNPSDRRRQCPIVWSAVPAPVPRAMWLFGSLTTGGMPAARARRLWGPPLVVVEELLGRFRSILD
jgi:hypothetical protein